MAVSSQDIKSTYPLPVYNFRVEIGSTAVAFSEVSGLDIQYEVVTFKESQLSSGIPGPKVIHMPSQATATNVVFKKGLVPATSLASLYDWIKGVSINQVEKKDISVILCDEKGDPVVSWKIINAFPTKLSGPVFDSSSTNVAVETMELRADGVTIEAV